MLNRALLFLGIAILAAIFGFFEVIASAIGIAKIVFYIFTALFISTFFIRREQPTD